MTPRGYGREGPAPRLPLVSRPRNHMRVSVPCLIATLVAASAHLAAPTARAQRQRFAPVVFQWPGGTRGAAMANAMVTAGDDEALFYNPAAIAVGPPGGDPGGAPVPMRS